MTTYTPEDLEAVPHYDGDACVCAWCSDEVARVMVRSDPICVNCRTIAYERALLQKNAALRAEVEKLRQTLARCCALSEPCRSREAMASDLRDIHNIARAALGEGGE